MQPVRVHAFRWLIIRRRRSAAGLSIKLTVSFRGFGPQYFAVTTAASNAVGSTPSGTAVLSPTTGALTGLILAATSAPLNKSRSGNCLTAQPMSGVGDA